MAFLAKWIINIAALFIVIHITAGVGADNWQAMITAAFVLGLLNSFLRPILIAFTLPINILSFGFFTLIINGFLFYLASKFVKGFTVMNFWSAFWASIVFSIISFILNTMLTPSSGLNIRSYTYRTKGPAQKYEDAIDVEATVEGKADAKE
jgi:putative membrane protein